MNLCTFAISAEPSLVSSGYKFNIQLKSERSRLKLMVILES